MAPHDHRTPQPSRRSVLGAAAWSVPAIAVVTASPAYANSNGEDETEPTATSLAVIGTPTAHFAAQGTGSVFTAELEIENATASPTSGLHIQVSVPTSYFTVGAPKSISVFDASGPWSHQLVTTPAPIHYKLVAGTQLAAGSRTTVTIEVELSTAPPTTLPALTLNVLGGTAGSSSFELSPTSDPA